MSHKFLRKRIKWLHIIFRILSPNKIRLGGRTSVLPILLGSCSNIFGFWFLSVKWDKWTRKFFEIPLSPVRLWQEVLWWRQWPEIKASQVSRSWSRSEGCYCSIRHVPAQSPPDMPRKNSWKAVITVPWWLGWMQCLGECVPAIISQKIWHG